MIQVFLLILFFCLIASFVYARRHKKTELNIALEQIIQQNKPWVVQGLNMQFVYVNPGTFQMGSNDGEREEKPVHQVTISKGYWIGKYEVTQNEYQSIIGSNPSKFKDGKKPVEQVSWNDAVSFCKKLTARERKAGRLPSGYKYCLPTEAQWEFAARGGTSSRGFKYSGSDNLDDVAWYYENSGNCKLNDSSFDNDALDNNNCRTHEVGTKSPNELGIYDMTGNVNELCSDWYGSYTGGYSGDDVTYYIAPGITCDELCGTLLGKSVTDPLGARAGSCRVIRGGSWNLAADCCRVSVRGKGPPTCMNCCVGFRVALSCN